MRWCLTFLLVSVSAMAQTAAPPVPAPPAGPPTAADRVTTLKAEKRAALDRALDALTQAATDQEAAPLEAKIRQMWMDASSPAVTLLMARGMRALKGGAHADAEQDFQAALALDPDLAEAWHQLAIARFGGGDTAGAIVALDETLRREPRHFAALQSLSRFAEAREDWQGAYAAWQKALEITPKLNGGQERLKDLRRRALGEET